MRLIIIGCEYTGKTTLAVQISSWMIRAMALPYVRWHNHFVVPRVDGHLLVRAEGKGDVAVLGKQAGDVNTDEDEEQVMTLRPSVLEQFQRHMIWRHLHPDNYREDDVVCINHYYADAVYAPLYYGYGEPGSFADRRRRAREWDTELLGVAPETVLVQVRASADAIRRRMRQSPRPRCVLKEQDVDLVLDRFQEEFDDSLIRRRFTLDTTSASEDETFEQFLTQMWPYLSLSDRLRVISTPDAVHGV